MLNRADFFDLLVRVARAKYFDVGQQRTDFDSARKSGTSIEESLVEFVNGVGKMVNKMTTRFVYQPWQEFRDNELWSFEVDAVYMANLDKLKKIYDHLHPKYHEDTGWANILQYITFASTLQVSEKETRFAYGMSKMTVDDEPVKFGRYKCLEFVEFLEFIGRLAHVKYKGMEHEAISLSQKIEHALDHIMPVFGMQRTLLNQV
jgi:hypothetical protein